MMGWVDLWDGGCTAQGDCNGVWCCLWLNEWMEWCVVGTA